MGFLAPAVPWIIKGGAALGGALLSRHSQNAAMARSPEEKTDLTGATNAATNLQTSGQGLIKSGQQTQQQGLNTMAGPTSYWSRLLGGNRASMAQATAAPRGAISDIYSGAERGLSRSGVRGASRDVAKGELSRERAGKIAGLTTGVQPAAAEELGNLGGQTAAIGSQTTAQGGAMAGQGANIFSNLMGQATQNRMYGRQEGEKSGNRIGGFIFDILAGTLGKKFGMGRSIGGNLNIPKLGGEGG